VYVVHARQMLRKGTHYFGLNNAMMKLETTNQPDWQGFSRILEVMSFVDEVDGFTAEECQEILERLCQLPPCPGATMSMEEVVFWAGVAAGMELCRHTEEGRIDPETAEKVLVFSSIFEHSTKTAIVDLALGDIEQHPAFEKTGTR
jgi:hypothetical protein